ncbi:MAG: hypothetical protein ACI4MJ_05570 [Aristaeellaceae bacterium]
MFLRKLTVMVVPLLLGWLLCVLFPLVSGLGFWSNVLKGVLLGAVLAMLLPLSGAGRKKERFAGLLWVPALLMAGAVVYQYLYSMGAVSVPALNILATADGQVVLVESTMVGYMTLQSLRTRQ